MIIMNWLLKKIKVRQILTEYFYFFNFLSLTIIWFSLVTKGYFGLSGYDYYFFKGSLVLTSITLITYFLKQSVKYQKLLTNVNRLN